MFGSVFRFSHLPKLRFFGFGVFHDLRVFLNLAFVFRFSSTRTVFRIFLSSAFYGFSVFARLAKEVTHRSRVKTGQ